MRILLAEDDAYLAEAIVLMLKNLSYQVEHCSTCSQTLHALSMSEFSLLILDLSLPDGFSGHVLKYLRSNKYQLPIMILTALDDIDTKLQLLNDGADDYIVKPFDMRELEVRIRVLFRRKIDRSNDVLEDGFLRLDVLSYRCEFKGEVIPLTRREFLLLKIFFQNKNKVLSRQHLEELIYGWNGNNESNSIEVHIHHLRKKLFPDVIQTVRGFGYILKGHQ